MRSIDVVVVLVHQPIAVGHQALDGGLLRRLALLAGDFFRQAAEQFGVQVTHQQPGDLLPVLQRPTVHLSVEHRDGVADAVVVQDQLEAQARVDAFVQRNLDDLLGRLFVRRQRFQRGGHFRLLAQRTQVHPSLADAGVVEE